MERLRTEKQIGGWRHFIGEDEIHCGDFIEILHGDDWIAGRYEAQGLGNLATTPIAHIEIDDTNYFKLQDGMLARWPERQR